MTTSNLTILYRLIVLGGWVITSASGCVGFSNFSVLSAQAVNEKWIRKGLEIIVIHSEDVKAFRQALRNKVEQYIASNKGLPECRKTQLRELEVHIGMTIQEVQLLLGEPSQRLTSQETLPDMAREEWKDTDEAWLYRIYSVKFSDAMAVLYFRQNTLSNMVEYGHYHLTHFLG